MNKQDGYSLLKFYNFSFLKTLHGPSSTSSLAEVNVQTCNTPLYVTHRCKHTSQHSNGYTKGIAAVLGLTDVWVLRVTVSVFHSRVLVQDWPTATLSLVLTGVCVLAAYISRTVWHAVVCKHTSWLIAHRVFLRGRVTASRNRWSVYIHLHSVQLVYPCANRQTRRLLRHMRHLPEQRNVDTCAVRDMAIR